MIKCREELSCKRPGRRAGTLTTDKVQENVVRYPCCFHLSDLSSPSLLFLSLLCVHSSCCQLWTALYAAQLIGSSAQVCAPVGVTMCVCVCIIYLRVLREFWSAVLETPPHSAPRSDNPPVGAHVGLCVCIVGKCVRFIRIHVNCTCRCAYVCVSSFNPLSCSSLMSHQPHCVFRQRGPVQN